MVKELLVATIILSCLCSCSNRAASESKYAIEFSSMGQSDRAEYVEDYIKGSYGVEATISNEIKKRDINSFSSEEYYYATAKLEDNNRIYCWIDDKGNIKDSYFILGMQDGITKLFSDILDESIEEHFEISSVTTLNNPSSAEYGKGKEEEMLREEDVSTSVRVYTNISERDNIEGIKLERLGFTRGTLYVYYTNGENTDLEDYNYMIGFGEDT